MARLAEVRAALVQARASPPAGREEAVDGARRLLRDTTTVRLEDGTLVAIDDGAVAARVASSDAALDAAIADTSLLIDVASRGPGTDLAAADARLRQLVGEHRVRETQGSLVDLLSRQLARWLAGLGGAPPDPRVLIPVAGGLGLAVLVLILGILGRDVRERFRREVLLPELRSERGADPSAHLRAAEAAMRSGDPREAVRALYLYALAALAAREAIGYDPSLTDREVLARAAGIVGAGELRELVDLHARVWYGLRAARTLDAERARALALRAVA